jgi:predicted acetyltransferase
MSAETLAMVYLGTWRPSNLAGIGRIAVHDPAALTAADRLFATDRPAWCGSLF